MTTREAVYTNLNPGSYRFRVIASNGDGIWNSTEAAVGFEIAPMIWQTWWFRFSGVLAFALAGLGVYRFRLHQLTSRLNLRLRNVLRSELVSRRNYMTRCCRVLWALPCNFTLRPTGCLKIHLRNPR